MLLRKVIFENGDPPEASTITLVGNSLQSTIKFLDAVNDSLIDNGTFDQVLMFDYRGYGKSGKATGMFKSCSEEDITGYSVLKPARARFKTL